VDLGGERAAQLDDGGNSEPTAGILRLKGGLAATKGGKDILEGCSMMVYLYLYCGQLNAACSSLHKLQTRDREHSSSCTGCAHFGQMATLMQEDFV